MPGRERYLRYSKGELGDIKKLYESVMSFAAHGMFFRTGKIMGKRIAGESKHAKDYFGSAASALKEEGWAEVVEFDGAEVVVKGSIESRNGAAPSCHLLRGVITCLYEEKTGASVSCAEVECESSGAPRCLFKIDGGDAK
ncbi:MAG: V4R domain-containing protein [Methanobacteriota archaeon]